jgi:hypothetical protein
MMAWGSDIERRLFAYLSPLKQAEVQDYLASLEDDPPTECANCGQVIGDHDSFCGEECQEEFMGETQQPDTGTHDEGPGMSSIRSAQ